jgi:hypothetical protein
MVIGEIDSTCFSGFSPFLMWGQAFSKHKLDGLKRVGCLLWDLIRKHIQL